MRADWLRPRCRHAAKRGFYWRFLPVSDTCRASGTRERDQTGGRSIIASLPSLVISSSSSSPSFVFFLLLPQKNNTHFFFSVSEGTLRREARLFFLYFLWQWTPLVRATKRAAKQRQSNGNRPVEILSDNSICSRCLVFFFFFLPSAGGVENKPTRARREVRAVGEEADRAR